MSNVRTELEFISEATLLGDCDEKQDNKNESSEKKVLKIKKNKRVKKELILFLKNRDCNTEKRIQNEN